MEDPVKEVVAAPERGISAWIGAILLSTSRWPWLSKEEWCHAIPHRQQDMKSNSCKEAQLLQLSRETKEVVPKNRE